MREQKPSGLEELNKPLDKIKEDIFCRPDNFKNEPWYNDFELYRSIGVCQPRPEHVLELRKALKIMGYSTHAAEHDNKLFLPPGEDRRTTRTQDRER